MAGLFSPLRLKKVWADLWANELRTLMSVLAVTVGLFGAGSVLSAYAILDREIDANYSGTNPPSFVLGVDDIDDGLKPLLVDDLNFAAVELRRTEPVRIETSDGQAEAAQLRVVEDFESLEVATFEPERGEWPPLPGQLVLERSSADLEELEHAGPLWLERSAGGVELSVAGVVHDPGRAPGWQDDLNYVYVSAETFAQFVADSPNSSVFNEVYVVVDGDTADIVRNAELASTARQRLESAGYSVSSVAVPPPGEHPHNDQMTAVLFLLQAFGVLTLLLAAVLVAVIVGNIVNQQRRQLGAMKAIGATGGQITGIYLMLVLAISAVAVLPGVFLASAAGRGIAGFVATLLNFDVTDNGIPASIYVVQILLGFAVPVLAAAAPIWIGVRMSVRDAMDDSPAGSAKRNPSAHVVSAQRVVGRVTMLAVGNVLRRRTRLAATILILGLAGATFTSAINLTSSWLATIDAASDTSQFDFDVNLSEPYQQQRVEEALVELSEVNAVEGWTETVVSEVATQSANADELLLGFLNGVPAETTMVDYPVLDGRWLQPGDTNAIVINHEIAQDPHIDIGVGDSIILDTAGLGADKNVEWEVVGVVKQVGAPRRGLDAPFHMFVNVDYLNELTGNNNYVTSMKVRTDSPSADAQAVLAPRLDEALSDADIGVSALSSTGDRLQILRDHVVVIVAFLGLMAVLAIVVGSLALTSLMSINVLERRREIGMMRAVGATGGIIQRLVLSEALIVGLLAWVVTMVITRPVSVLLGDAAGQLFLRSDLENVFSWYAALVWLVVVLFVSLVAAFYPARQASRLAVNAVLAFD